MATRLSDVMTVNGSNEITQRPEVTPMRSPVPRNCSYEEYKQWCERERVTPDPLSWAGLQDDIGECVVA